MKNDDYKQKLVKLLKACEEQIAELRQKTQNATEDFKVKYRDEIAILEKKRDQLKKEISEFGQASGSAIDKLKEGMENAYRDLKDAVKNAIDKFK